jgi:hypothetical protein
MPQQPQHQQYRVVMEEIYRGPWVQRTDWGYYTGEPHPYHLITSRSVTEEHAMLFWAEEAVAFVLLARKEGVPCHLEPPITVTF